MVDDYNHSLLLVYGATVPGFSQEGDAAGIHPVLVCDVMRGRQRDQVHAPLSLSLNTKLCERLSPR